MRYLTIETDQLYFVPNHGRADEIYWKAPVFVDIETTGLKLTDEIISCCAVDLEGNKLVYYKHPTDIELADPIALEVNGYTYESWQAKMDDPSTYTDMAAYLDALQEFWAKKVVVGVNPYFDIERLQVQIDRHQDGVRTCHYKPLCLSNLALGIHGYMPSLDRMRELYNLEPVIPHVAENDVFDGIKIYKAMWQTFVRRMGVNVTKRPSLSADEQSRWDDANREAQTSHVAHSMGLPADYDGGD